MKKALIALIGITGGLLLLKEQLNTVINSFDEDIKKLIFKVHDISNLSLSSGIFKGVVKLEILNNTPTNINASTGGFIKLTRLDFYTKTGTFIGTATPTISSFDFPANSRTISEGIPVEMPLNISSIPVIASILANPKNIKIKPTLQAFNQTYTF